jgi:hypothetical protein
VGINFPFDQTEQNAFSSIGQLELDLDWRRVSVGTETPPKQGRRSMEIDSTTPSPKRIWEGGEKMERWGILPT